MGEGQREGEREEKRERERPNRVPSMLHVDSRELGEGLEPTNP